MKLISFVIGVRYSQQNILNDFKLNAKNVLISNELFAKVIPVRFANDFSFIWKLCIFYFVFVHVCHLICFTHIYIYAAQHNNQHVTSFKRTKQKLHQIRSQLTLLFAVKGIYTILILVNIATKFSVNRLDKHELSSFRYLSVVLICFLCFNKYI